MRLITDLNQLDNNKEYLLVNRELTSRMANNVWTLSDNNVKTIKNKIESWNDVNSRFRIQRQENGKYHIYLALTRIGSINWKLSSAPYRELEFTLHKTDNIFWRFQSSDGFLCSNADDNHIWTGESDQPGAWFHQFLIYEYDGTIIERVSSVRSLRHNDNIFMICESQNSVVERHREDGNWITVYPDSMQGNDNSRSHDIWQDESHFQVKSMPLYYLENWPESYSKFSQYTLEELQAKITEFAEEHRILFGIIEDDIELLRDYIRATLTGFTLYSSDDGGRTLHDAHAGPIPNFTRLLTFDEYSAAWIWRLLLSDGSEKLYYCPVVVDTMDSTAGASPGLLEVNYIPSNYPAVGNVARAGHMYRAARIHNNNLAVDGGSNNDVDRFTIYRIRTAR